MNAKRFFTALACVLLLCLTTSAFASVATMSWDEIDCLFISDDGMIYSSLGEQLSTLQAEQILVSADTGVCYVNITNRGVRRIVYESGSGWPVVRATSVNTFAYAAPVNAVYYTTTSNPAVLYAVSPVSGSSKTVCTMAAPVVAMQPSQNGVIITCRDTKNKETNWLLTNGSKTPELTDIAREYVFDTCSVRVMTNGTMKLVQTAKKAAEVSVDTTPGCVTKSGNVLYYTKDAVWNSVTQLRSFKISNNSRTVLTKFSEPMCPPIVADEYNVYLLTQNGDLMCYGIENGKTDTIASVNIALADTDSIKMELCGEVLFIYDAPEGSIPSPLAAFMLESDFLGTGATPLDIFDGAPVVTAKPVVTKKPVVTPKPTATPLPEKIKNGDKGDQVKTMQQKLIDLGYLAKGQADGQFGAKTLRAVKLFQEAVGVKETGVADRALLQELYSKNAPECDLYAPLSKGAVGTRVTDLQTELANHGYIGYVADGEYGNNTVEAVKRLQSELGYKQTGSMTSTLMKYVYNGKMPEYSDYIELTKGCSGPVVKELQNRLKYLGYYTGKVNSSYDTATANAVKLFQKAIGFKQTGTATVSMQTKLYAKNAPVYEPDPTKAPTPKPTKKPSPTGQPSTEIVIGPDTKPADIYDFQAKLYDLGYLKYENLTSKYDAATKTAIGTIQVEMLKAGYNDMPKDGRADGRVVAYVDAMLAEQSGEDGSKLLPVTENEIVQMGKWIDELNKIKDPTMMMDEEEAILYVKDSLQTWGWYPSDVDFVGDNLLEYDDELVDIIVELRDIIKKFDSKVKVSDALIGHPDKQMTAYIWKMSVSDPNYVKKSDNMYKCIGPFFGE